MLCGFNNKKWIDKYKYQLILSICLILAPFLTYFHLLFDDNNTAFEIFGHYYDLGFSSIQFLVWSLLSDITSITILCVLFFSISDSWKYGILLPIMVFQQNWLRYYFDLNHGLGSLQYLQYCILVLLIGLIVIIDYRVFRNYRRRVMNLRISSLFLRSNKDVQGEVDKIFKLANSKLEEKRGKNTLYSLYNTKISFEELFKVGKLGYTSDILASNNLGSLGWFLLILTSISLWILHYFIPDGVTKYTFGLLLIQDNGFLDAKIFMWFISRKLMVIVPSIIWFFTYHSWWRYAILPTLVLFLFQFWEAFQDVQTIEAHSNIKVFPLVFLSILLVLALSRIVRRQSQTLDAYEQISLEIEQLIKKLSDERSGLGEYRRRYKKVLETLVKSNTQEAQLDELTRLQQELKGKVG